MINMNLVDLNTEIKVIQLLLVKFSALFVVIYKLWDHHWIIDKLTFSIIMVYLSMLCNSVMCNNKSAKQHSIFKRVMPVFYISMKMSILNFPCLIILNYMMVMILFVVSILWIEYSIVNSLNLPVHGFHLNLWSIFYNVDILYKMTYNIVCALLNFLRLIHLSHLFNIVMIIIKTNHNN